MDYNNASSPVVSTSSGGETVCPEIIGDSIVSALGFTAEENYLNVKRGITGLCESKHYSLHEPVITSEIDDTRLEEAFMRLIAQWKPANKLDYTRLEKAAIVSVAYALSGCRVEPASPSTLFILSSTKGNINILASKGDNASLYLFHSAELIAKFFGNVNYPVVVSTACISGASAIIMADRFLKAGKFDNIIVTGVDVLSDFIISGFQSFKALSSSICRPFDINRRGLNIGEAAATMVLSVGDATSGSVSLKAGTVYNDANHISAPSRTGEGSYLALRSATAGITQSETAFINAHGTATTYNDAMEAIAIGRAGWQSVPVFSLKGYFGHTLGAAGVLESIISARAIADNYIPSTYGFDVIGVSTPLQIVKTPLHTSKKYFVKMLSGFGGCNAVLSFFQHK